MPALGEVRVRLFPRSRARGLALPRHRFLDYGVGDMLCLLSGNTFTSPKAVSYFYADRHMQSSPVAVMPPTGVPGGKALVPACRTEEADAVARIIPDRRPYRGRLLMCS